MNLFGLPSQQNVNTLHSILKRLGSIPRDGYMLGISLSYNDKCGAYIDTDCFDDETEDFTRTFDEKDRSIS